MKLFCCIALTSVVTGWLHCLQSLCIVLGHLSFKWLKKLSLALEDPVHVQHIELCNTSFNLWWCCREHEHLQWSFSTDLIAEDDGSRTLCDHLIIWLPFTGTWREIIYSYYLHIYTANLLDNLYFHKGVPVGILGTYV